MSIHISVSQFQEYLYASVQREEKEAKDMSRKFQLKSLMATFLLHVSPTFSRAALGVNKAVHLHSCIYLIFMNYTVRELQP